MTYSQSIKRIIAAVILSCILMIGMIGARRANNQSQDVQMVSGWGNKTLPIGPISDLNPLGNFWSG